MDLFTVRNNLHFRTHWESENPIAQFDVTDELSRSTKPSLLNRNFNTSEIKDYGFRKTVKSKNYVIQ